MAANGQRVRSDFQADHDRDGMRAYFSLCMHKTLGVSKGEGMSVRVLANSEEKGTEGLGIQAAEGCGWI